MAEGGEELQEINNLFNDHFGLSNTNETPLPDHDICITESEDGDTSIGNEILVAQYLDQCSNDKENENPFIEWDSCVLFKHCNCENKCIEKFSSSDINDHILSIRDMLKEEKEQLIMTILNTVKISDADTRRGSRKRPTSLYCFEGKKICRQAFMILYDITDFSLRALCEHVHGHGVSPRKHGNTGRKPIHALHFDDVMKIVTFLRSYADENGLPQPAAPRGRGDLPPIYLHSSLTKKAIHSIYVESLRSENGKCVKRTTFCQIWKACVPHIVIASPRHDVCSKCEQYRKKIVDAVTESEKMAATSSVQTHIQLAQEERNLYLTLIRQSKTALETAALLGNIPSTMHYTFDFAQNVTLPHHARQMGPLYFLSLKKVTIYLPFLCFPSHFVFTMRYLECSITNQLSTNFQRAFLSNLWLNFKHA
ncbi:uncharacterized protein LOC132716472 [Ruditapes philippinarum]|uniref:uncharacterized protein LOC132716472 n=1 Tax=Ruditapes philippinarum TaxID=129788 RepID=UPI00295C18D3|nr:uncharacterized protein LOC132716472 [Ruditapes philippinarum]